MKKKRQRVGAPNKKRSDDASVAQVVHMIAAHTRVSSGEALPFFSLDGYVPRLHIDNATSLAYDMMLGHFWH